METVAQVIVFFAAEFLERIGRDVVVGDHEAVGRDEGSRAAAVEAHGGLHEAFEPRVGEVEAVFLFDLFARRGGVEPHAFVGVGGGGEEEAGQQGEGETQFHRRKPLAQRAAEIQPEATGGGADAVTRR